MAALSATKITVSAASLTTATAAPYYKDLAIYISPVLFYPIEVVFGGGVCGLKYSYENRIKIVPKKLNKIINGSLTYIIIVSSSSGSNSSRPFYWILFKEANLYYTLFLII